MDRRLRCPRRPVRSPADAVRPAPAQRGPGQRDRRPPTAAPRARTCSACRARSRSATWSGSSRPGMPRKSFSSSRADAPRRCRTRRRRRAPGRSAPRDSSASNAQLVARPRPGLRAVGRGEQRVLGGPDAVLVVGAAGRARGRARPPARRRSRAGAAPTAGTPTRSRRAAGPGRTGRPPGRRTAASTSTSRRRRRRAAGTSTPSETIRTATIQRCVARGELLDPLRRPGSSESTTSALSPVIVAQHAWRRRGPASWSVAMTSPPASGTCRRTSVSRRSAAAQHRRDPLALRVERGAPGLGGEVLGQRLAEPARRSRRRPGAPAHLRRSRPGRAPAGRRRRAAPRRSRRCSRRRDRRMPSRPGRVGDERDRVGVGAERRAGQREPAGGRARTPRAPRRPRTARRRRGGPRRGSPACGAASVRRAVQQRVARRPGRR